jgi:uncharacterized protein (DUF736 family)
MAFEQRDNSGSLFKNEKKEQENHPDYNGTCMVDGEMYYMNAWLKKSQSGKTFMSFAFKPKEEKQEDRKPAPQRRGGGDDAPF